MAKLWTLVGAFWLVLSFAFSAQAQISSTDKFSFYYAGETLSVPMVPLMDNGQVDPDYLALYESLTSDQIQMLAKDRERKLQLYTFLLEKIKLTALFSPLDKVAKATQNWSGPVVIPKWVMNKRERWGIRSKVIIQELLIGLDRMFWNNLRTEYDIRLSTSRGVTFGFGVYGGIGARRALYMAGFTIGVKRPEKSGDIPHYFISVETEKHHPDSVRSSAFFGGTRVDFWHSRDARAEGPRHMRTEGYFIGTPLTYGRQRAQATPGDGTLPGSTVSVGFQSNKLAALLLPTLGSAYAAAGSGSYVTAAVLVAAWFVVWIPPTVNGLMTVKDIYRVGPTENTPRWISESVNSLSQTVDESMAMVEPVFGFMAAKYEDSLALGRIYVKRYLNGTLFNSTKRQCQALILYR